MHTINRLKIEQEIERLEGRIVAINGVPRNHWVKATEAIAEEIMKNKAFLQSLLQEKKDE